MDVKKSAFQTSITIKEAIESIHKKKYLLPAIQGEFVWGHEKIIRLFDSLMRDYTIGSFLLWNVDKDNMHILLKNSNFTVLKTELLKSFQ